MLILSNVRTRVTLCFVNKWKMFLFNGSFVNMSSVARRAKRVIYKRGKRAIHDLLAPVREAVEGVRDIGYIISGKRSKPNVSGKRKGIPDYFSGRKGRSRDRKAAKKSVRKRKPEGVLYPENKEDVEELEGANPEWNLEGKHMVHHKERYVTFHRIPGYGKKDMLSLPYVAADMKVAGFYYPAITTHAGIFPKMLPIGYGDTSTYPTIGGIDQGTDYFERLGNEIDVTGLEIAWQSKLHAGDDHFEFRFILVEVLPGGDLHDMYLTSDHLDWFSPPYYVGMPWPDLYESQNNPCILAYEKRHHVKLLHDSGMIVNRISSNATGTCHFYWNKKFKLDTTIEWHNGVHPTKGGFALVIICGRPSGYPPTNCWKWRMTFYDKRRRIEC